MTVFAIFTDHFSACVPDWAEQAEEITRSNNSSFFIFSGFCASVQLIS